MRIGEQQQRLLATAAVLAGAPLSDTTRRATARALADAGTDVAEALAHVSRAGAMATRIHEVAGLDGAHAEAVRAQAGLRLNLSLSRTRLALDTASEALRHRARSERDTAVLPPARRRAAALAPGSTPLAALAAVPPAPTPPRPVGPASALRSAPDPAGGRRR
ncbi:hypothetical protein ACFVVU_30685 [Kitasatospora sp. NPDC057965]|uniref:hypothetical protein n=1 Tax=Kitasatospora sp. NPDC057965 TaxID=3346291 RepID=UPI0036DAB41F